MGADILLSDLQPHHKKVCKIDSKQVMSITTEPILNPCGKRPNMKNKDDIPQTLCPDQIDQTRQLMNWCTLIGASKNQKIDFDHADSRICGIILGKRLHEAAVAYADVNPEYKSLSNMVELLIWRELGSRSEFLQSTSFTDRDQPDED